MKDGRGRRVGKTHDSRTALRLPQKQRKEIDRLVSKGKYKSLSHFVRVAIEKELLSNK
jgi:Arc/MetJ-type ribon-helix-helix transcriptional regulator